MDIDIQAMISALDGARPLLFTAGHATVAAMACVHVLLKKRESRAAQVWLIICVFVPYLGPFAYFLLGINRIETRARRLREPSEEPPEQPQPEGLDSRFAAVGRRA